MKLLFVYSHPEPQYWKDGLYCALKELEKDFEITYLNLAFANSIAGKYDFTLGWGGFNSPIVRFLDSCSGPRGLCIGGNAMQATEGYDVLFYETDWAREFLGLDKLHSKLVKAFGINNNLFHPGKSEIIWDYLGAGALANWKRWEKMIDKRGRRLVIGDYQKDNEIESLQIVANLIRGGVMVANQVLPHELAKYYHQAKTVYIPSSIWGGGERVVLESRACGCEVEIEKDNPKLKELLAGSIPTYKDYAEQLRKGICG